LAKAFVSESGDAQAYGVAGDMFGGLNTLFAGLAFAFVAVAAYYQRQTMLAQREELEAAKQQGALQAFEPLFFQLVQLFRTQQQEAHIFMPPGSPFGGFDTPLHAPDSEQMFRRIAQEAHLNAASLPSTAPDGPKREIALQTIRNGYSLAYKENDSTLGPLLRTLYHAFRLIAESGLDEGTQVRYANIARGLLGSEFLMLVMLNCLCEPGAGLKPYVEHFGLLKHIRRDTQDGADQFVAGLFEPTAQLRYHDRQAYWQQHNGGVAPKLPD